MGFWALCWACEGTGERFDGIVCDYCDGKGTVLFNDTKNSFKALNKDDKGKDIDNDNHTRTTKK